MVEENGTDALQGASLSHVMFCFVFFSFLYRSKAGSFARSTSLKGGKKKSEKAILRLTQRRQKGNQKVKKKGHLEKIGTRVTGNKKKDGECH